MSIVKEDGIEAGLALVSLDQGDCGEETWCKRK